MKRNVFLVGGRSKAKSLAQSLIQKGYQVTVVNSTYVTFIFISVFVK